MSEAQKNNDHLDREENYESSKLTFDVMASYDVPKWFKNHVWLWPIVVSYLFILYMSSPENLWFSFWSYGLYIVGLDLVSIWIRRHWPI